MSYVWSGSLTPTNGADTIFKLKTALVNIGWTVVSSSNGTVLSSGDIITSASVLTNNNSYFIIKQPLAATSSYGGWQREFGFQRSTTNLLWRVSYTVSSSHQFGGTATVMASGSDRRWCFEGTTYQAGNFGTLFGADASYRLNICTEITPPFGFYGITFPNGGGNPNCMVFDPLLSGSFISNDPDPTIQWFQGDSNAFLFSNANGSNVNSETTNSNPSPRCWLAKQSLSESYTGINVPGFFVYNAAGGLVTVNANVAVNHVDSTDNIYPIYYVKPSTAGGISSFKGISTLFSGAWVGRSTGDTLSIGSSKNFITFRHFIAIWDGSTPTV